MSTFSRSCWPTHATDNVATTRTCAHYAKKRKKRTALARYTRSNLHDAIKLPGIYVRNTARGEDGERKRETKRVREREIKKKGGTRCHSKVRNGRREETFERGKKPYASAAAIRRRRIAMLRSLALSLAASTAAQFLHANQPTDPPSTHHLTNHPSTPAASSIPSRPHTPPVSLPLNASPSSLWTATFAHIPSSFAPLPSSTTTPHPHSIAILSSFSFFLSSTDNLRLHPRIRTLFLIRLLSRCPFPIYSSTLFSRTNVSSFFPFSPLFCFFPADRARFFLRNKIIRRSFRARLTSLVLRVEEGESQVWFGRVSPLVQVLSGKRVEVGRGRRRKLELC